MSLRSESTSAREAGRPVGSVWARLVVALVSGALVSAGVAALSPGAFWHGWLAALAISTPLAFALLSAWQWAGGGRLLGWLMALAFFLRLVAGIGLSLALPAWGYDEPCQNAGYLFKDACNRDQEAYSIAHKNEGLYWFSGITLDSDQYGGLSFLSAWVYRYLSADAHRPFLILLLGAAVAALGVPFLYLAVRARWPVRVAALAAWIYALYPDAIFFSASQMREPFLVGLSAIAFWAVITWERSLRRSLLIFALCVAGMMFFSLRVALMIAGMLAVWFWLEFTADRAGRRWQLLGWGGLAGGLLVMAAFTWGWFHSSASWDILLTWRNSGQMTAQIKQVGEQWVVPLMVGYGLTQPLLPAAIADTSIPLAQTLAIIRAIGWYALAPFLLYGLFAAWREPDPAKRRRAIWLALAVALWVVIASARGGGDTVDNPRYRSLLIPWMAVLAAWAIDWAISHRDAWLWRWIAVEVIFLGFFTHWYLGRYFRLWMKMPFWQMLVWIVGLSGLVVVGGWAWDRWRPGRARIPSRVK